MNKKEFVVFGLIVAFVLSLLITQAISIRENMSARPEYLIVTTWGGSETVQMSMPSIDLETLLSVNK